MHRSLLSNLPPRLDCRSQRVLLRGAARQWLAWGLTIRTAVNLLSLFARSVSVENAREVQQNRSPAKARRAGLNGLASMAAAAVAAAVAAGLGLRTGGSSLRGFSQRELRSGSAGLEASKRGMMRAWGSCEGAGVVSKLIDPASSGAYRCACVLQTCPGAEVHQPPGGQPGAAGRQGRRCGSGPMSVGPEDGAGRFHDRDVRCVGGGVLRMPSQCCREVRAVWAGGAVMR